MEIKNVLASVLVPSSPNDGWGIACKPITDFFCRHDGSRSEDLEWNLLSGRLDQLTQRFPRETGKRVGARRSVLIKPWSLESPAQMSTEGPGNCLGHQEIIPHAQQHLLRTYSTEVAVKVKHSLLALLLILLFYCLYQGS